MWWHVVARAPLRSPCCSCPPLQARKGGRATLMCPCCSCPPPAGTQGGARYASVPLLLMPPPVPPCRHVESLCHYGQLLREKYAEYAVAEVRWLRRGRGALRMPRHGAGAAWWPPRCGTSGRRPVCAAWCLTRGVCRMVPHPWRVPHGASPVVCAAHHAAAPLAAGRRGWGHVPTGATAGVP